VVPRNENGNRRIAKRIYFPSWTRRGLLRKQRRRGWSPGMRMVTGELQKGYISPPGRGGVFSANSGEGGGPPE